MSGRRHEPGPPNGDDPLAAANEIDALCDQFEAAWKAGAPPTIESFLNQTGASHRARLFGELVRIEIEYRLRRGEQVGMDDYLGRFQAYAEVLAALRAEAPRAPTVTMRAGPARTLGRYELAVELGGGGFGVVWRAWDTRLHRWVAVKIPKEPMSSPVQMRAFLKEARAAAGLDHPNIVAVLDMGVVDGAAYLASRLVEGVSLRRWIKQHPQPPVEVARMMVVLCEAMDHAGGMGIVHRDLKPSNILVDREGQPHITDFGLALRPDDGFVPEVSGAIIGTPAYMSPEQVTGRPKADHRADVYGLGATLYEMLCGQPPFQGEYVAIQRQVLDVEPAPVRTLNPSVPPDLARICQKAMEKDRADRYQTAGAMADDLRRFAQGEPIDEPSLGQVRRRVRNARRWARKNRAAMIGCAAALVAVGLAIATWLVTRDREPVPPGFLSRSVRITTEPKGARIVCWRLDDRTGEPTPDDDATRTEPWWRSPVRVSLRPGGYLIVAVLPNGRFHEVFREVPPLPAPGATERSGDPSPSAGTVELTPIVIPSDDVTADMVRLAGQGGFRVGVNGSHAVPSHYRDVPDFFIDPQELSVAQGKAAPVPRDTVRNGGWIAPNDQPLCLSYHESAAVIEALGKRLPTEVEFEFAATNGGRSRFPWGDDPPTDEQRLQDGIGPVGTPDFDALPTSPPVRGLCTNVAEWTTTYHSLYPPKANIQAIPVSTARLQHVVRGPLRPRDELTEPRLAADYDPRSSRRFEHFRTVHPGIGFRGVRSVAPRLKKTDFRAGP